MSPRRVAAILAAVFLAALYGVRAVTGIRSGLGYPRAVPLAARADYDAALDRLVRAGAGFDRFEALWLRGQVRLGLWDRLAAREGAAAADPSPLRSAAQDFLDAGGACPPSAWPLTGLAEVYQRLGRKARLRGAVDMAVLDEDSWRRLDRREAVALGLARMATEREPMVFHHWDAVVKLCLRFDLHDAARQAVASSAAVQPAPLFHADLDFDAMPRDLAAAFADASRASIGKAPLLSPERHRLFLGQLELRLGRLDLAEADFRAAHDEPGDALNKAEDRYFLGIVLAAKGDTGGAERAFDEAARHPVFVGPTLVERASILEREGRLAEALDVLQELRRLEPRQASYALRSADLARRLGNLDRAEEALRWAIVVEPENPAARVALVEVLVAEEKTGAAKAALDDFELRIPGHSELERLRTLLVARRRAPEGGL